MLKCAGAIVVNLWALLQTDTAAKVQSKKDNKLTSVPYHNDNV